MTEQLRLFADSKPLKKREQISIPKNKSTHGWRSISVQERIEASKYIDKMECNTREQIRAKAILTYFVNENMSAQAISKLDDPRIVVFSNRKKGKRLSGGSILEIIYQHFPDWRGRQCAGVSNRKRVDLIRKREKQQSPHIKQCAFCGNTEKLEEHHMIPLFMGGTNDDRNLIFLCHKCHLEVTKYQRRLHKEQERQE